MPQTSVAQGDEDPQSASVLIRNYLATQGLEPTANNVRMALQRNARNTDQPGADPVAGLRNYGSDADPGVGRGGGSVASKIEGNKGPIQDQSNTTQTESEKTAAGTDNKQTSAQPGSGIDLGSLIVGALPFAGAAGMYGASKIPPRVGDAAGPMPDVGGQAAPPGDQYRVLPDESGVSPMEMAMRRAVGGPDPAIALGGPPQPQLPAPAPRIEGPPAMPQPAPAAAAPGVITPPPQPEGMGPVPIQPKVGPQPAANDVMPRRFFPGRVMRGFIPR